MNITTIELDLSWNQIVTIHPKAFWTSESNNTTTQTALKRLHLDNNNIKYIKSGTFDPLINLEYLYLYSNTLGNIDNTFIINLNKLKRFSISHNQLTQLPTKWLPNTLQRLYIESNEIKYVSSKTFEGALNLTFIELSLNNITIEYNTFSMPSNLTIIVVDQYNLEICTCKYIWYLNTKSNSNVCDNSNNKYASIKEYLKEECKPPGYYII